MDMKQFLFIEALMIDHRWSDIRLGETDEDALESFNQLWSEYQRCGHHYKDLSEFIDHIYIGIFGFNE